MLPIRDVDVVLGVQWLRTLGKITWDFSDMTMSFEKPQGGAMSLTTMKGTKFVEGAIQAFQASHGGAWLLPLTTDIVQIEGPVEEIPGDVTSVLEQFPEVFEEPTGLPPQCNHDHRIELVPGATSVNVRPYRYAHSQKSEIERLVREMLDAGSSG